jgi:hypothetical protein
VFGALTDGRLYDALLARDTSLFFGLVDRLTQAFLGLEIGAVVADPAEGYNPAHDVCRLLASAASARAAESGRRITSWDYALTESSRSAPPGSRRILLDEGAFARKRAAAEAYPEMKAEVDAALARDGLGSFRTEVLRPVDIDADPFLFTPPPLYEKFGEQRLATGTYVRVVRFREHLMPLAEALLPSVWRRCASS